jgi:hypothetical protein
MGFQFEKIESVSLAYKRENDALKEEIEKIKQDDGSKSTTKRKKTATK